MCIEGRAVCLDGRWEEHSRRVHMGVRPFVRPPARPPLLRWPTRYIITIIIISHFLFSPPSLMLVFPMVGQLVGRSQIAVLHDPYFAFNLPAQQNFRAIVWSFQVPTWNVNYSHLLERRRFIHHFPPNADGPVTGPSHGEAKFLSFCVCFSDDATAAAAAVGVDAHCEGGGILPSRPPSRARWRGPPSSARPGRSPAEVKKPWRTKNVGDSEDFMRCIMRHNTSSRLSPPVNVVFEVSLLFPPDSGENLNSGRVPRFHQSEPLIMILTPSRARC